MRCRKSTSACPGSRSQAEKALPDRYRGAVFCFHRRQLPLSPVSSNLIFLILFSLSCSFYLVLLILSFLSCPFYLFSLILSFLSRSVPPRLNQPLFIPEIICAILEVSFPLQSEISWLIFFSCSIATSIFNAKSPISELCFEFIPVLSKSIL